MILISPSSADLAFLLQVALQPCGPLVLQSLFALEAFLASVHAAVVKYAAILGQLDIGAQNHQRCLTTQAQALLRHLPPDDETALRDFIKGLKFRMPTLVATLMRLASLACYSAAANPFTFLDEVDAQLEQHGKAQISAGFFSKHLLRAMVSLQERFQSEEPGKLEPCMDQLGALQYLLTAFTELAASAWNDSAADATAKIGSLQDLIAVFRDHFEPVYIEQRSSLASHVNLLKQIISHLAMSIFRTYAASLQREKAAATPPSMATADWSLGSSRPLTIQDLPATLQISATAEPPAVVGSLRASLSSEESESLREELNMLLKPFSLQANLVICSMPDICKAICDGLSGCLWACPIQDVMEVCSYTFLVHPIANTSLTSWNYA